MVWTRNCLALSLALAAVACGDDGASGQDTENVDTGTSAAGPSTNGPETTDQDGTGGCVPGQAGCSCLDEQCVSGSYCVEAVCVLGPLIMADDVGRAVVGGVVVPIEVQATADEYSWSQVSGPEVEILGAQNLQISVVVPADAPPGEVAMLRFSASRNGVTLTADVPIEILDAVFEDALPEISDPMQLGTTEGLAFGPTGMWVASSEGFVSQFSPEGGFIARHDVPGEPVGMDFNGENLLIANREGTGHIDQLNSVSGTLTTLFDGLDGGGPLGTVNLPLVQFLNNDDLYDVYVSTRLDQTVLRWSSELGSASVFLQDAGVVNPNALTFGPEGGYLFVGAQGHVWRVPMLDGNVAGPPEDYLVLGDDSDITYEVDGLAFDEGANLWVGCPNASTLFVSHYSVMGPAEISRTFVDVGGGVSRFVNLAFGSNDFGEETLYYSNLADGTVGRLRVGLRGL